MRRRRFLLIGLVAAAVATAEFRSSRCAFAAGATAPGVAFDSITYRDSGGFAGGGTGKSLRVSRDGIVEAAIRQGAAKTLRLDQQELTSLSSTVQAVDWASIQPQYLSPGAADLMRSDLTIVMHGTQHETRVDGLARLPPSLKELLGHLDALYRRARSEGKSEDLSESRAG